MSKKSEKEKIAFVEDIVLEGITCQQLVEATYKYILESSRFSEVVKARCVKLAGQVQAALLKKACDKISIAWFLDSLQAVL